MGPDQRWTGWSRQIRWPPVWAAFRVQKQALRPNPSVLQAASFQLQRALAISSRAHPRCALVRSRAVLHGAWPWQPRSATRKACGHAKPSRPQRDEHAAAKWRHAA